MRHNWRWPNSRNRSCTKSELQNFIYRDETEEENLKYKLATSLACSGKIPHSLLCVVLYILLKHHYIVIKSPLNSSFYWSFHETSQFFSVLSSVFFRRRFLIFFWSFRQSSRYRGLVSLFSTYLKSSVYIVEYLPTYVLKNDLQWTYTVTCLLWIILFCVGFGGIERDTVLLRCYVWKMSRSCFHNFTTFLGIRCVAY